MAYKKGSDRRQRVLFPDCIDEYVEAAFQRAFCAVNGLSADVKNLELCNITDGELCFRNFADFFAEQRLADRGFIGDDVLVGSASVELSAARRKRIRNFHSKGQSIIILSVNLLCAWVTIALNKSKLFGTMNHTNIA